MAISSRILRVGALIAIATLLVSSPSVAAHTQPAHPRVAAAQPAKAQNGASVTVKKHVERLRELQARVPETVAPQPESMESDHEGKPVGEVTQSRGALLIRLVRGDPKRREVALTFDDGPHPPFTSRLLDLLLQLNVRATFFLVGKKVDVAPQIVLRMVQEGHDVANHTYYHVNLSRVPLDVARNEILLGNEAIRRACRVSPIYFRPPGGHHESSVLTAAEQTKMVTVLWTDDPADYANPGAGLIESRLLNHVKPGAIILLHDGIEQTFAILPNLVSRLRHEGYKFVTVSEMAQHLESSASAGR